jgi:two-component system, cell cycle response regulator CpdR
MGGDPSRDRVAQRASGTGAPAAASIVASSGAQPRADRSGEAQLDEAGSVDDPAATERAVLVVDDDPSVRAYVARALTLAHLDVTTAGSGREAMRLVADGRVRPDVLITDIDMPEMNGVELAARLLALRPTVRVVMMTGDAARAESARKHPSIVDTVLVKPVPLEELVAAVRSAAAAAAPTEG